ncbi:MAG: hypothetical protein IJ613_09865, partial [Muribaculaceae bacterium]|nr:hypothetical protein [Muribaculaceae bacterium]
FIQAGQSAKKTFTAALKPVEYHELLNKYEIFFLKNSKIFARYFRKHAPQRPAYLDYCQEQARRAGRPQAGVERQRNPGDRDKTNIQALKGRQTLKRLSHAHDAQFHPGSTIAERKAARLLVNVKF